MRIRFCLKVGVEIRVKLRIRFGLKVGVKDGVRVRVVFMVKVRFALSVLWK